MSRHKRELRAERTRNKTDARRIRKVQRERRKTQMRMTVVSAVHNPNAPTSVMEVVGQTNVALLYADMVTLVSPTAAYIQSTLDVSKLEGSELMSALDGFGKYQGLEAQVREIKAAYRSLQPGGPWTNKMRREQETEVRAFVEQLRLLREAIHTSAQKVVTLSGFDQLQLAIDAGILTVEPLRGLHASKLLEDTAGEAMGALIERIDEALTSGRQYPLFDGQTNQFVRGGVELGIFAPTPIARRLGKNAAMANGLFDRLPNFPQATTSEILDIRTELSSSLGAFRTGVASLAENIDVPPEDPDFGNEVERAWTEAVAPAIDEIEEIIQENKSMRDLAKRIVKDPMGGAALGFAAASPFSLAVAAGPVGQLVAATGMVFGVAIATARGLVDESDEMKKAKQGQFYFLYGTNEMLGIDS